MKELDSTRPLHPLGERFNLFLQDYQEDIRKIIGKYRYSNHHLDPEEIASRANLALLKKREDILYEYEEDFDKNAFSKIAYTYIRNIIGWSHTSAGKDKYIKNRLDSTHNTDEGPKTSFDFAILTEGYEDSGFEAFDSNEKFTTLLHVIKEYCHILTEGELKILSCLESGMTHEEISNKFKFTRQAVSAASINLFEKIKSHFSCDVLNDDVSRKVSDGNEAIEGFFKPEKFTKISKEDRAKLKNFLLSSISCFTSEEVSKKFMNGKYTRNQIISFCAKNKLNFCLNKPNRKRKITAEESKQIANLYNQGKNRLEISKILDLNPYSISSKKGHLSKQGLINGILA
jgi:transcriptional regulator